MATIDTTDLTIGFNMAGTWVEMSRLADKLGAEAGQVRDALSEMDLDWIGDDLTDRAEALLYEELVDALDKAKLAKHKDTLARVEAAARAGRMEEAREGLHELHELTSSLWTGYLDEPFYNLSAAVETGGDVEYWTEQFAQRLDDIFER